MPHRNHTQSLAKKANRTKTKKVDIDPKSGNFKVDRNTGNITGRTALSTKQKKQVFEKMVLEAKKDPKKMKQLQALLKR